MRPLSTQRQRLDGQDAPLQRPQFRGQHSLFRGTVCVGAGCLMCWCVCVMTTYARRPCVRACVCVCMRWAGPHNAQNGSQWTGTFRTRSPWRVRAKGRKMMMRRVSGCRPIEVQQGRSSLLMKSHLRPPFTLNMGHCSCPDLGFDPPRCLTPTVPPELTPRAIWTGRMHMYTYVCAHTP